MRKWGYVWGKADKIAHVYYFLFYTVKILSSEKSMFVPYHPPIEDPENYWPITWFIAISLAQNLLTFSEEYDKDVKHLCGTYYLDAIDYWTTKYNLLGRYVDVSTKEEPVPSLYNLGELVLTYSRENDDE